MRKTILASVIGATVFTVLMSGQALAQDFYYRYPIANASNDDGSGDSGGSSGSGGGNTDTGGETDTGSGDEGTDDDSNNTDRWYVLSSSTDSYSCNPPPLGEDVEFENGSVYTFNEFFNDMMLTTVYNDGTCFIDAYDDFTFLNLDFAGIPEGEFIPTNVEADYNNGKCESEYNMSYHYSSQQFGGGVNTSCNYCPISINEYNSVDFTEDDRVVWDQFLSDYKDIDGNRANDCLSVSDNGGNNIDYKKGFTINEQFCSDTELASIQSEFPYDTPYPAHNLVGGIQISVGSRIDFNFPNLDFLKPIRTFNDANGYIMMDATFSDISGIQDAELNGVFKIKSDSNISNIQSDSRFNITSDVTTSGGYYTFKNNYGICSTSVDSGGMPSL